MSVGKSPLYDICNRRGDLIWRRDQTITRDIYEQLTTKELYFDRGSLPAGGRSRRSERAYQLRDTSSYAALEPLPARLDNLLSALLAGNSATAHGLYALTEEIEALCDKSAVAAFGLLQLDVSRPDYLVHPMQSAVIAQRVATDLALSADARRALMAAALTQDVGMLQLHKKLERAPSTVTKEQLAGLKLHAQEGAKLLAQAGVGDRIWLKAVLFHHETRDGSAGSYHLSHDDIPLESRILAAADGYIKAAKPTAKGGRGGEELIAWWSEEAYRNQLDPQLMRLITDHFGAIPPGALAILELKKGQDPNYIKPPVAVAIRPSPQIAPGELTGPKDPRFFPNVCIINDNGKESLSLQSTDLYLQQRRIRTLLHPRAFTEYNKNLEVRKFWD